MVNEKDIKMAAHSIYFKNADKPKETVIARDKVDKIITKLVRELNATDQGTCDYVTGNPITDYVIAQKNAINEATDDICKLIREVADD